MRTNPFSSSKKLILSLATISCSSSLALAQIYEGYTHINSHQTNSKTISSGKGQDKSGLIWIEKMANIRVNNSPAINIEKDANIYLFYNQGIIQAQGNYSSIQIGMDGELNSATIKYFYNAGAIGGSKFGLALYDKFPKQATIHLFTNEGVLQGNEAGILIRINIDTFNNEQYIYASTNNGIWIAPNVNINHFNNQGLIFGQQRGLVINQANIDTFNNKGIIGGENNSGINFRDKTNINTFTNEGLIFHNSQSSNLNENYGIYFQGENNGKIQLDSFKNSGIIYASNGDGILFEGKDIQIGNFINTGIIVGNHSHSSNNASVLIGRPDKNHGNTTIDLFLNEGLIGSNMAKYGVKFDSGNDSNGGNNNRHKATVKHFINTATIQAKDTALHLSNTTITDFLNMDTIKAENGKAIETLKQTRITNFINAGTIKSESSNQEAIKFAHSIIDNILNTGNIEGKKQAIIFNGSNVKNFINSGTIKSTNNNQSNAIQVNGNRTINNFINTGTIYGDDTIKFNKTAKINYVYNTSIIYGGNTSVHVYGGNIDHFVNKGIIANDKTVSWGAAIKLENGGTIKHITNTGLIASKKAGISVTYGKFGTITLEEGSIVYGEHFGVCIAQWQNLDELIIVGSSQIASGIYSNHYGIFLGTGSQASKIELKNQAVVQAKQNAIKLENQANLSGLNIDNSTIKSGQEAILNAKGKIADINVNNGALIQSYSNTAISNLGTIDKITISGTNTKIIGDIQNKGTITSGITIQNDAQIQGQLVNEGTIKADANGKSRKRRSLDESQQSDEESKAAILIKESGQITSTSGKAGIINKDKGKIEGNIISKSSNTISLENQGSVTGNISNSGSGTLMLNNFGSIGTNTDGYNISNEGSGSVNITSWTIRTGSNNKLQTLTVGGKSANSVMVGNLIVDQGNLNMDELNDIKNLVKGVSLNNIKKIKTNGGGEMILNYDALSGKISTDFNLNASIIGASFRSLNASSIKRNAFVDGLMNNMNLSLTFNPNHFNLNTNLTFNEDNLYASINDYIQSDIQTYTHDNIKEHALVILPYFSSQSVELSLNEKSKGHIKGNILAYSTLKESGTYSFYAGYEDTKMNSYYFDVKNRTYYTGIKYFNTLFYTDNNQEVYIKAQAKAAFIKNEFLKKIANNEASANPNAYTYGGGIDLGMNFILGSHMLTPQIGLGYEGSYMQAYSIKDIKGRASVQKGERIYKNINNLFSTKASFAYFKDWLPYLKTSIELGAKLYMNTTIHTKARFGTIKVEDEINLARIQRFANASLILPLNQSFIMSMNYNAQNSKDATTHTAYAQFSYLW
ncbi:autotransporter outer membrane beta-barrel domain-containing protein [Campylobacter hepaticus]|uniref:autotransporter outer membrane beta-barrel domain-containing protein n=1 Tax=Campylobacter hepaticus TaxID=1813019 RepID=UPI0022A68962|nr:autotransporter outer membrane beta-barrel domain-containing protein [Campylobacter hepaticus]MCZ0771568.1 autotransporter outer membrane beta-barrel domain-containing protein [Campylobacter hepaticus]MCZ0773011.1 autotransporter outer membrane beta-barrel domain-containing protein [Campylobacter hepaticus]MCZ0775716.1 autotransporter outer membrane beta-barrel domain-containing protein [Campylobacter hepaticus]WAP49622.1 autotransporter outer membrane beta-barrel domain-containing protein [